LNDNKPFFPNIFKFFFEKIIKAHYCHKTAP
jgi:hypothetical protein